MNVFRVKVLAFAPVVLATFACAWLADAQDSAPESASVSGGSEIMPGQGTPVVAPLTATVQPVEVWPKQGEAPAFPLLDYTDVARKAQNLLQADYEDWRAYLGTSSQSQTLPQNLLKTTGCVSPCEMYKALLIVNPAEQGAGQGVYVAMVENGHVLMRPSLMSWPDAAIAPLKKWLATNEAE